jgi:hypothetical protein
MPTGLPRPSRRPRTRRRRRERRHRRCAAHVNFWVWEGRLSKVIGRADHLGGDRWRDLDAIAIRERHLEALANARRLVRAYGETLEKLELLFPRYGLTRTGNDLVDFRALAARMARDLFRGFEIVDCNAPKPYQHKRGNPVALMGLLADVEAVKQQRLPERCSDSEAVRILSTSSRFAHRWGRFEKSRTLQNWLVHAHDPARNKMLPLYRLAADHGQLSAMINLFGSQPA